LSGMFSNITTVTSITFPTDSGYIDTSKPHEF
jgi:hypothetical protein